jgi:hypothetical protein
MSLAALVQAQPTKEKLLEYQNSCALVNQYAYAITNTTLPSLTNPPEHYAEFVTSFTPAKEHCLEWSQGIFPEMLAIPRVIAEETADLFELESTMVSSFLEALIDDPTNEHAKRGLARSLDTMRKAIQAQVDSTVKLKGRLDKFATALEGDTKVLTDIAEKALKFAGDDEQRIKSLTKQMDELNKEVEALGVALAISQIGTAVSLFVGVIGIAVCFIPGAQAVGAGIIVLAVIGEAASIAGWVLSQKAINDKNASIQQDRKLVDQYKQDIIALQAGAKQFQWLESARLRAASAMDEIVQMWAELDAELADVASDLADVGTEATSEQYVAAQVDMQKASVSWNEVLEFALALSGIDYKWQDSSGTWHSYKDKGPGPDAGNVERYPAEA